MQVHNKTISQREVFDAKFFVVKEDKIELPNGDIHTHRNIYRVPAAIVFPLTSQNEIYLIKQYRYLLSGYIFEAIAGYVENKEIPLDTAKRELEEEAGLLADSWKQIFKTEMSASVFRGEQYFYLAKNLSETKPKREAAEQIEVVKLSLDEAVKKVMKGEIRTSSTIIGILLLEKFRNARKL